jgi:hypothetical protein
MVLLLFLTQKAQHRRQRCEADPALAQAGRVEPGLVKLEPCRQQIRDPLMQARDQQAPDTALSHAVT